MGKTVLWLGTSLVSLKAEGKTWHQPGTDMVEKEKERKKEIKKPKERDRERERERERELNIFSLSTNSKDVKTITSVRSSLRKK